MTRSERQGLNNMAEVLSDFLHGTEGQAEQRLVWCLIRKLQRLGAILPSARRAAFLSRANNGQELYDLKRDRRTRRLIAEIQRILALPRFRLFRHMDPIVVVPKGNALIPHVGMTIKVGRWSRRGTEGITEPHAIQLVLDLWNAGFLRVRKCPRCRKWFVALWPKKEYCKRACYDAAYGPKWREKKLDKNPDYFSNAMKKSRLKAKVQQRTGGEQMAQACGLVTSITAPR